MKKADDVQVEPQGTYETEEPTSYWFDIVETLDVINTAPWTIMLPTGGSQVKYKVDTGADVTLMDANTYKNLPQKPPISPTNAKLMSPGGRVACLGEFVAHVPFKDKKYNFKVVVAHCNSNLLGRSVASQMGIIIRADTVQEQVFGPCGLMDTDPVKIHLRDDAKPYCVNVARRVPFPILQKVKDELNRLRDHGVIEPVQEPSEWCAPMVPVLKKNGKIRITVDFKRLDNAVRRQQFMLPNLDDIAPKLANSLVFSSLDTSSGFFQIPLEESSSALTTFITPFGRFRFKRIPMGITSSPEIFQKKMSELLAGHEGCDVIMDDILIYGKDEEEHDARLEKVLKTIQASGLRLNKEKCHIKKKQLIYFGHLVGADGIQPNPEKVEAIQKMPAPENVAEVRTLVGMINYLGRFVPSLPSTMKPILDFLKEDTAWNWDQPQQHALDSVKNIISNTPCLAYYNPTKPTMVSADASSFGLGGALFQQLGDNWMPIAFCSRTLTPAETKYAQIEKECLASVWACEKFSRYLIGLDQFELQTDHKPLVPLMTTRDLDECPIRCQRLLMRLMRFNPKVRHVPGKSLVTTDALSRKPLPHGTSDETKANEITKFIASVQATWPTTQSSISKLQTATAQDRILQKVASYVTKGWPGDISLPLKPYQQMQSHLSIVDGLITCGSRIVVPQVLQSDALQKLHETHQGQVKCQERA